MSLIDLDVARLIQSLDKVPPFETLTQKGDLLQSVAEAFAFGDVPRALSQMTELARSDPRNVEALPSEPVLAGVRSEVEKFVTRLTLASRTAAEKGVEEVREELGSERADRAVNLLAAERLIEAGGYFNYVRSFELSRIALGSRSWAPVAATAPRTEMANKLPWRALRHRSPVTVVLWVLFVLAIVTVVLYNMREP